MLSPCDSFPPSPGLPPANGRRPVRAGAGVGGDDLDWQPQGPPRLGLALTQMLRDGVVTAARAKKIADAVLRGNAAELYGLTL